MTSDLNQTYERDRCVWDACALTYEEQIVAGHPDVTAYEAFEEDLLDRLLMHLIRDLGKKVRLYDVGCGSGRLHLRYGLKTAYADSKTIEDAVRMRLARQRRENFAFDPSIAQGIESIGGVDFSAEMIELARQKLAEAGLGSRPGGPLDFDQGSAFELRPFPAQPLPLLVTVCNSIGVMQGPAGAVELFKSMRRAVEASGGIALISAYRKDAVQAFALGNYESTMDVCGQPRWLTPEHYAVAGNTLIPRAYKRAYDPSEEIVVDVFDRKGDLVEKGVRLRRDPAEVEYTIRTGHIRTFTDYESCWYGWDRIQAWIDDLWPEECTYHLAGRSIDALRAAPAQLAILDADGHLREFIQSLSGEK